MRSPALRPAQRRAPCIARAGRDLTSQGGHMSAPSTVLTRSGLLAAMLTASAWAAPVAVPPGASDLPIPVFSGSAPTVTLLGSVDNSITKDGVTVTFQEWAVDTSLNP